MKVEVKKSVANRLINCGEVILVSCAYKDKKNVTTCAWHMPLSKDTPLLSVALAKKHFSSEIIRKSEEFVVNVPEWSIIEEVICCGKLTGWNVDKFKESGLSPQKPHSLSKACRVAECIGHLECSLVDIKEVGDHYLFIGEIIYAEADDEYFKGDFWDTEKVELIFHLGSTFFFKSTKFVEFRK